MRFACLLDRCDKPGSLSFSKRSSPESGSPPMLVLSDLPSALSSSLIMGICSSSDEMESVSTPSSDSPADVAGAKSSVSVPALYRGSS